MLLSLPRPLEFVLRPGLSDLFCAILLIVAAAVLASRPLEPTTSPETAAVLATQRDATYRLLGSMAGGYALIGLLLMLPYRLTLILGATLHVLLLVGYALVLLGCVFLLVTVLAAGIAFVVAPPALILILNSFFSLGTTIRRLHQLRSR